MFAALIAAFIAVAVYSKTITSCHCAKVNSPYFSACLCVFFSSFIYFFVFPVWLVRKALVKKLDMFVCSANKPKSSLSLDESSFVN